MLRSAALFCCDIQGRFRPLIHNFAAVVHTAQKMGQGAKIFNLPVIVTEQYPKALGTTVEELSELKSMAALCQDKMQFSMVTKEVDQYLESNNHIKSIALFGIESHVCVLQTALDLRKRSLDVYLITDGISSSDAREIPVALEVMKQAGCVATTSDSFLFRVCGSSSHPQFKQLSQLVKDNLQSQHHNSLL